MIPEIWRNRRARIATPAPRSAAPAFVAVDKFLPDRPALEGYTVCELPREQALVLLRFFVGERY